MKNLSLTTVGAVSAVLTVVCFVVGIVLGQEAADTLSVAATKPDSSPFLDLAPRSPMGEAWLLRSVASGGCLAA